MSNKIENSDWHCQSRQRIEYKDVIFDSTWEYEFVKFLDEHNINICKTEILANIRLEKYSVAHELLTLYVQRLNEMELSLKEIKSDITWEANHKFILAERDWANRMIVKVKAMQ